MGAGLKEFYCNMGKEEDRNTTTHGELTCDHNFLQLTFTLEIFVVE
jgi:hypothetical protein